VQVCVHARQRLSVASRLLAQIVRPWIWNPHRASRPPMRGDSTRSIGLSEATAWRAITRPVNAAHEHFRGRADPRNFVYTPVTVRLGRAHHVGGYTPACRSPSEYELCCESRILGFRAVRVEGPLSIKRQTLHLAFQQHEGDGPPDWLAYRAFLERPPRLACCIRELADGPLDELRRVGRSRHASAEPLSCCAKRRARRVTRAPTCSLATARDAPALRRHEPSRTRSRASTARVLRAITTPIAAV